MKYRVAKANNWDRFIAISMAEKNGWVISGLYQPELYKVQFKKHVFWHDCQKCGQTIYFQSKESAEHYLNISQMQDCGIAEDLMSSNKPLDPEISKFVDDNFWDLI